MDPHTKQSIYLGVRDGIKEAGIDPVLSVLLENIAHALGEPETLRDRFAMAALTGILARRMNDAGTEAQRAYEIADAMLEARKEER
jgi:hypothetical protein